jgi:chromosome segregation ATPase
MKRTPPAPQIGLTSQQKQQHQPQQQQQQQQQKGSTQQEILSYFTPNNKRSRNDYPETDIDDLIKETGDVNRAMMMMMQRNHDYVTKRFDNLEDNFTTFHSRLEGLGTEVSSLKDGLESTNDSVMELQQKLDDWEQEKLSNHMTINGIDAVQVDGNKNNMKSFVTAIIRSFNIQVEESQIEQAFSFPVGNAQRRVIVIFNNSTSKHNIMAAKRVSKDERKIFFDHRTTAKVGELLRQVRAFSNINGGRAFLYGGHVFFQKDPAPKIRVKSLKDISTANLVQQ